MSIDSSAHRPELLLPAGDMEKLKTAIRFGADAVYLGTEDFGLRAHAGNFSLEELKPLDLDAYIVAPCCSGGALVCASLRG